jgi:hypothetical protein
MSLDISISRNGETLAEINWLRNPFGLCQWAEDNTRLSNGVQPDLRYVCNHRAFGNSGQIDRALFLRVVYDYWERIQFLKQGYFYFDLPSYRQFIEPHVHLLPQGNTFIGTKFIVGSSYDDSNRLRIPMEHFSHDAFALGDKNTLQAYKNWFARLVHIAERRVNNEPIRNE